MKFKVGDKVIVKSKLRLGTFGSSIGTIVEIIPNEYKPIMVEFNRSLYNFKEKELEKMEFDE